MAGLDGIRSDLERPDRLQGMAREKSRRSLVVYAWDGRSPPLEFVTQDTTPDFDLLLFDYSGGATPPANVPLLSRRTECKGDIYREVHAWLQDHAETYEYVGLLDDDIELAWSDINRLLRIACDNRFDSFAASLTGDSHHAHARFLARPGSVYRPVAWVEVMMPFYRSELFLAGGTYYATSISSYGLDQFVLPTLQKLGGYERIALIDAVVVRHARPITSDGKVFSNGLTAHQERVLQRRVAMAHVARERPDLIGTRWYFRTFSPWDGPARFWALRLLAPWLWLRGVSQRRLGA